MTTEELSELTPNQKRIRIAELHEPDRWEFKPEKDYVVIKERGRTKLRYFPANSEKDTRDRLNVAGVPNYLGSVDAMRKAEDTLTGKQQRDYATAIGIVAGRGYVFPCYEQGGFNLLHTDAPQRADAFLLTMG